MGQRAKKGRFEVVRKLPHLPPSNAERGLRGTQACYAWGLALQLRNTTKPIAPVLETLA